MAITTATVTIPDISTYTSGTHDPRRTRAYATTKVDGGTIFDTDTGKLWLGGGSVTMSGNSVTYTIPTPGDSNPASWQTYFHLDYADAGEKGARKTRTFGPFTVTESATLESLVEEQEVPPTYLTQVTQALDAKVTAAETARDEAEAAAALATDISGISTPDGLVKALIENPASETAGALSASTDARANLGRVLLKDYCAEDGTTDDGPNILAAAAQLITDGGGTLVATPGVTYYVNSDTIITAPGLRFDIEGGDAKIVAGPAATAVLRVQGTMTQLAGGNDSYAQTTQGDMTLTPTNDLTGSVAVGDLLMIWSSDVDNPERPASYLSGEPARVVSISSGAIGLDRPIRLNHTSGADRRLFKINPVYSRVSGLDVTASPTGVSQRLLEIRYAVQPVISRCHGRGKAAIYGLYISQALNARIEQSSADDMWDANNPTAPLGYGLVFTGVSTGVFSQIESTRTRHAVDVGSFSSLAQPGMVSTDITIEDGTAKQTWAPAWSSHHSRNLVGTRLKALGCGGGAAMRGIGWALRDLEVVGGLAAGEKPAEWSASRVVEAAILVGENDTLTGGAGLAGSDVVVDNLRTTAMPASWRRILWSDAPGAKVSITGPGVRVAPDVIVSDSAVRADGAPGEPDQAFGGRPQYDYWAWQQGAAGVVIASNVFTRPTGSAATTLRTPVDVPADVSISAQWVAIGTPANMNGLFVRGDTATVSNGYVLGVSADGTLTLFRFVSGASTNLQVSSSGAVVNGDVIELRARGRRIEGLVNGTVVVSGNSNHVTAAGRVGFYFRSAGGDGWQANNVVVRDLSQAV